MTMMAARAMTAAAVAIADTLKKALISLFSILTFFNITYVLLSPLCSFLFQRYQTGWIIAGILSCDLFDVCKIPRYTTSPFKILIWIMPFLIWVTEQTYLYFSIMRNICNGFYLSFTIKWTVQKYWTVAFYRDYVFEWLCVWHNIL